MMKQRILFIIGILLLLIAGYVYAEVTGKDNLTDNRRFQLFQGSYTTYDLKRQQTASTTSVFLIDTKTGVVKRYVNRIDEDGKYIETWLPTEQVGDKR